MSEDHYTRRSVSTRGGGRKVFAFSTEGKEKDISRRIGEKEVPIGKVDRGDGCMV